MIKGTTSSGFAFEIDERLLDSIKFVRRLARLDAGEDFEVFPVIDKLLGEEDAERLYEHCDDSVQKLKDELVAIFDAMSDQDEEIKKD